MNNQEQSFRQKLDTIVQKNNSLLCIGLDSTYADVPICLRNQSDALFAFHKAIIDATADLVCAYKPNATFFEADGPEGIKQLIKTASYLVRVYPHIPVILDCKRADIGNTNIAHAHFVFNTLGVDAVTLHPYLGKEALHPYLSHKEKGIFILCKTSNAGSGEFQNLDVKGKPLYHVVAEHVAREWDEQKNCGLVVGATYPEELRQVRDIIGDMPLLIPGIGAQGGDVQKSVEYGTDQNGGRAIISMSRHIIFASKDEGFEKKVQQEAQRFRDMINQYRKRSL